METVAVLDFETTGLSPSWGDRPTEIAVALVSNGRVVDRFQSLMNPGRHVPWQVTQLTGITNEMVSNAPSVNTVMRQAARFVGRHPIVAHNASFDRKFWEAELERLAAPTNTSFACTMLIARRLYPSAPNHKLGTLVDLLGLPRATRAHRAMADAEMAAHLWCRIERDLRGDYGVRTVTHDLLTRLQCTPRAQLRRVLDLCG
jgi:DNA polymerase-3 subunit epsilon